MHEEHGSEHSLAVPLLSGSVTAETVCISSQLLRSKLGVDERSGQAESAACNIELC